MNVLLVGCGKKFGRSILDSLVERGHAVHSISSEQIDGVNNINIDWATLNPAMVEKQLQHLPVIDFVFFNHNGSALSTQSFSKLSTVELWKLGKRWNQQYYNSVIFPFHLLQSIRLDPEAVVSWMVSSYVYNHADITYTDYIGNKYQSYLIMKQFSNTDKACFCGVNPDSLYDADVKPGEFIEGMYKLDRQNLNGTVICFDYTKDRNFDKFNV
jgi:hypothetical protein